MYPKIGTSWTRDLQLSRNASRMQKPEDHVDVVIGTLRASQQMVELPEPEKP
jgi:hypothetical protein